MNVRHRLSRDFFARPTLEVAPQLLGKVLVRQTAGGQLAGMITEAEAYRAENDPAAHGFTGITQRNKALFNPPGFIYIYRIYGQYQCLNIVTESEEIGAAVLIRAVKVLEGESLLRYPKTNGPGKLCTAFDISLPLNGSDTITSSELYIEDWDLPELPFTATPRIGITKGTDKLWRFVSTQTDV